METRLYFQRFQPRRPSPFAPPMRGKKKQALSKNNWLSYRAFSFYVLWCLHNRFWESHRCVPLSAPLNLARMCNRTAPLECIAQGHFSRVGLTGEREKKNKDHVQASMWTGEALAPGSCGERAHSRHLRASNTPCGISDGAVHTPHALIHVLYPGATSGGLKAGCAVMHTSVKSSPLMFCSTEQWAWLFFMSPLLHCPTVNLLLHQHLERCLILPSNPERVDAERLSRPSLSDHLLLIQQAWGGWTKEDRKKERVRESQSWDLFKNKKYCDTRRKQRKGKKWKKTAGKGARERWKSGNLKWFK